ncbi:SDR family NAD(P)-dependent oxidoreductase [Streptomyces globosus]|uniref:SDR family NAD(P)-dependent oxidoreductase n=1 Tax=Streptomyces globosus TaxID=68209 RepID=UPI0038263F69
MHNDDERIAVIGLAGRFPGASDIETFWSNVTSGRVSVDKLSDEQLRAAGVPESRISDPNYVKYAPLVGDASQFDAGLFGFTRREAELRDPQQRIFLEVSYSALENAGIDPWQNAVSVGVFASGGANRYAEQNIRRNAKAVRTFRDIAIETGNHNDYVATIVSYKLNLRGPALTVATACSSSLVAVHMACQALRNGECDVALAGGVQLEMPYGGGHPWVQGGILTRSGLCRPFDADADGTIFGNGAAAVVLKPLTDARRDGDRVLAVIRGSAINNDGDRKVGFTAPSIDGQFAAIYEALTVSGVDPADIGYLEAHGTGTSLGDPIEVQALTKAYQAFTDRRNYCAISSVKGNIGHLGPASGVSGLVKAVLSVSRGVAPGTASYRTPNPLMGIEETPFLVTADSGLWPLKGTRFAGVSSFGVGGTNAHVVIEEGGAPVRSTPSRRNVFILPLAAASEASLRASVEGVADYWTATGDDPADIAHTLRRRPQHFKHRLAVVGTDRDTIADSLAEALDAEPVLAVEGLRAAFLFPGQGAQHIAMARDLHAHEPVFRMEFDRCLELFGAPVADVLSRCLLDDEPQSNAATELSRTEYTQPALFAVEWALTALWSSWGVEPAAMIGHSIGEIVAATVAGVFDLPSAARLVVLRGQLLADSPEGRMVGVPLSREEAEAAVAERPGVWVSADNGLRSCVVAGLPDAVAEFVADLGGRGLRCVNLDVSRAFHTPLMEEASRRLTDFVADLQLAAPNTRWVSNVTGDWITDQDAVSPAYWGRHVLQPVRFREALEKLAALENTAALEVGPGRTLSQLARRQMPAGQVVRPLASLPPGQDRSGALATLYQAAATLWQAGLPIDWMHLTADEQRHIVAAPGYSFDRQSYWIAPDKEQLAAPAASLVANPAPVAAEAPSDDRLTVPHWTEGEPSTSRGDAVAGRRWMVIGGRDEETRPLLDRLLAHGAAGVVAVGARHSDPDMIASRIREELRDHQEPLEILHLALVGERPAGMPDQRAADYWLDRGYRPIQHLLAEIGRNASARAVRVTSVASGMWNVSGAEPVEPGKAPAAALLDVAAKENIALRTRVIDIPINPDGVPRASLSALLWQHIGRDNAVDSERLAVRGHRCWSLSYRPVPDGVVQDAVPDVKAGQVWVITGGLGALGLVAAESLAGKAPVRLALLGRRGLPPRDRWTVPGSLDEGQRQAVEAIGRMEALGATVLILDADVADRDAMTRVWQRIKAELGAVHGVVHAAGIAGGGMLVLKDPATAEAVLRPKIHGTQVLDELAGDEPAIFVLFSSIASITGQFGLGDYAAANAYLDAFAHERARRRPGRTVAVNWPSWAGAGMAVEAAGKQSRFQPLGHKASAVAEAHAMVTGPLEPEIEVQPSTNDGARVFIVRLEPSCWVVDEHRIGGQPALPGTGYLDLVMRSARTFHTGALELVNVTFTAPLAVTGTVGLRISFTPDGQGWQFRAESPSGTGSGWLLHCSGRINPVLSSAATHDLVALRSRHGHTQGVPPLNDTGGLVTVGPRWNNVAAVYTGDQASVLLDLSLPSAHIADTEHSVLHAALFDCATAFAAASHQRKSSLPFAYRRIVVREPLPAAFTAIVTQRPDQPKGVVVRDVTMLDHTGREVVTVEGFTLREVDRTSVEQSILHSRAKNNPDASGPAPVSPATVGPAGGTGTGRFLDTAHGARLFEAFIGTDIGPQVLVTVDGLARTLERAQNYTAAAVQGTGSSTQRATPARTSGQMPSQAVVVPVGGAVVSLEGRVAELWSDILGLDVRSGDDFFELGGDSLAAVQMVERVRVELGAELAISELFDHRTLAEFSAAVAAVADPGRLNATLATPGVPSQAVVVPVAGAVVSLEGRVAELWSDILGLDVRSGDDFFELGGDSLAAVQMVERVRVELGAELAISELFDHRTLAEFVVVVKAAVHG